MNFPNKISGKLVNDKFRVCLLAKGFTQIDGVGYRDTFSHVMRTTSIRLLLALVAHWT